MKASLTQQAHRLLGGALIAALTVIGFASYQPHPEPGLPVPTLPEPDPTAPPLPGGGA